MLKGPVISGFCFPGETASGKLSHVQMIGKTLAAYPFSGARVIGAVAFFHVFFLLAIHPLTSCDHCQCHIQGGWFKSSENWFSNRAVFRQNGLDSMEDRKTVSPIFWAMSTWKLGASPSQLLFNDFKMFLTSHRLFSIFVLNYSETVENRVYLAYKLT